MLIPRGDTEVTDGFIQKQISEAIVSWVTTQLNLLKKAWVEMIVEQQQNWFT